MTTTMNTGAASLSDEQKRAAITACALMIKGICLTTPNAEWTERIENRIHYLLRQIATTPQADAAPSGVSDGLRKLIAAAADCISEAVTFEQDGFDTAPMPATQWDYNADQLAYALRAELATIAAGGAQETIYQRNMSGAWIDTTLLGYENWPEDQRRIVYASPLPRVAATVALTDEQREAIEWAAGRAHVEALGKPIGGAEGKRWRLLSDMFRAAASNGEQA